MLKKLISLLALTVLSITISTSVEAASQYTVKKGDTLWSIAKTHEVTVSEIKEWNDLHTDLIHPGLNLLVSKDARIESSSESTNQTNSKEMIVKATAYTASCEGCSGITATGINLKENPNAKVISVDPSVIPLGSKVYVEGYGEAIAGDTGRAIKGNKIDVFMPSKQDAINFGVKELKITILD
ncbi:LysM peptidoglycan-binding domain-containing protein [bacterium LRH843]|nr:LysM peptidoglycan-binding domain-containing protein [bacterium LRH843]